jgi:hypothetical protein
MHRPFRRRDGLCPLSTPRSLHTSYLDGSTGAGLITINGTYTSDFNSNTDLYGSIVNNHNLQVNGGNGTNTYLNVTTGTVTLTGVGTVSLCTIAASGGNANLYVYGGNTLDNINNTINSTGAGCLQRRW